MNPVGKMTMQQDQVTLDIETYYRQIRRDATDLATFAAVVDYAAAQSQGNTAYFMQAINRLVLNSRSNLGAIVIGVWERTRHVLHHRWRWVPPSVVTQRFGSSGFAADDGSNQVQHFWYFVTMAYTLGPHPAEWFARYHEWNGPGIWRHLPLSGGGHGSQVDLDLSHQGITLGRMLAQGSLPPAEVGNWLRDKLGPAD